MWEGFIEEEANNENRSLTSKVFADLLVPAVVGEAGGSGEGGVVGGGAVRVFLYCAFVDELERKQNEERNGTG